MLLATFVVVEDKTWPVWEFFFERVGSVNSAWWRGLVPHFFMMAYCCCGLLRLDEAASCCSVTCASFLWDSRFLWLCRCLIAVAAWVI